MRDTRDVVAALRDRPVLAGVLAASALALVARFWALGWRTAHWDEGRVGLVILRYLESGQYVYTPDVHGPFLYQVNRWLFDVFGATDAVARVVVALVGGLLPLAAWLLRSRLREREVIALALVLAANPVMLYYSRFMRNDVLVGAFALFALAFAVRAIDVEDHWYLYAATAALALSFTAKENALIYVGCWVGALALLVDNRFRIARAEGDRFGAILAADLRRVRDRVRAWWLPIALCVLEFFAIVVVFFAPRPDLPNALRNPTQLPDVIGEATLGSWDSFWALWVAGQRQDHGYVPYFREYVEVLLAGALVVVAFAVVGILADRYGDGEPRALVSFASYWGVASLAIYPIAMDISPAPWNAVHTIVPLAIPAAVGLGYVYRLGRRAFVVDDRERAALAAVVLVLAGAWVGWAAVGPVYLHPQDPGTLVQYGQPDDRIEPTIERIAPAIREHDGTDVLFYGEHFASNELHRMPFPWYLEAAGAEMAATTMYGEVERSDAPVVIAPANGSSPATQTADDVEDALDGYVRSDRIAITLEQPGSTVWAVVFVEESFVGDRQVDRDGLPADADAGADSVADADVDAVADPDANVDGDAGATAPAPPSNRADLGAAAPTLAP